MLETFAIDALIAILSICFGLYTGFGLAMSDVSRASKSCLPILRSGRVYFVTDVTEVAAKSALKYQHSAKNLDIPDA